MKKISLIILASVLSVFVKAQDNANLENQQIKTDSAKMAISEQAALLFPRIRQFTISHEENGAGNIVSKLNGNDYFEGKFRSSVTKINFNMPILQRNNNTLVASLGVIHQFYELSDVQSFDLANPVYDNNKYIPMLSTGLTYIRQQQLFGKQMTFTASATGLFNPAMDRNQFTFTGIALYPFIQKADTRLSVGAVVILDPASPTPFFLMVNYYHKFTQWDMDLMLDLPYRAALRKQLGKNTSVSFFNELGGTNSFFDFSQPMATLPAKKLTLSSMDIKSGFMAEYRLSKKAVISFL
jgi:hypothetical protein